MSRKFNPSYPLRFSDRKIGRYMNFKMHRRNFDNLHVIKPNLTKPKPPQELQSHSLSNIDVMSSNYFVEGNNNESSPNVLYHLKKRKKKKRKFRKRAWIKHQSRHNKWFKEDNKQPETDQAVQEEIEYSDETANFPLEGNMGDVEVVSEEDVSKSEEITVSFRKYKLNYLFCKKQLFFKPKFYLISKEKTLVNCINFHENESGDVDVVSEAEYELEGESENQEVTQEKVDEIYPSTCDKVNKNVSTMPTSKNLLHKEESLQPPKEKLDYSSSDIYQGDSIIQKNIGRISSPLIGLEYVLEVRRKITDNWNQFYHCILCDKEILSRRISKAVIDHVGSFKHVIYYLEKYFPSYGTKYSDVMQSERSKILFRKCQEIEHTLGRKHMFITNLTFYKKHFEKIRAIIENSTHLSESDMKSDPKSQNSCHIFKEINNQVLEETIVKDKSNENNSNIKENIINDHSENSFSNNLSPENKESDEYIFEECEESGESMEKVDERQGPSDYILQSELVETEKQSDSNEKNDEFFEIEEVPDNPNKTNEFVEIEENVQSNDKAFKHLEVENTNGIEMLPGSNQDKNIENLGGGDKFDKVKENLINQANNVKENIDMKKKEINKSETKDLDSTVKATESHLFEVETQMKGQFDKIQDGSEEGEIIEFSQNMKNSLKNESKNLSNINKETHEESSICHETNKDKNVSLSGKIDVVPYTCGYKKYRKLQLMDKKLQLRYKPNKKKMDKNLPQSEDKKPANKEIKDLSTLKKSSETLSQFENIEKIEDKTVSTEKGEAISKMPVDDDVNKMDKTSKETWVSIQKGDKTDINISSEHLSKEKNLLPKKGEKENESETCVSLQKNVLCKKGKKENKSETCVPIQKEDMMDINISSKLLSKEKDVLSKKGEKENKSDLKKKSDKLKSHQKTTLHSKHCPKRILNKNANSKSTINIVESKVKASHSEEKKSEVEIPTNQHSEAMKSEVSHSEAKKSEVKSSSNKGKKKVKNDYSPLHSRKSSKSLSDFSDSLLSLETISSIGRTYKSPLRKITSPIRRRSPSPFYRKRRLSQSPVHRYSRSPLYRHSRSPYRKSIRSPLRQKPRSPLRRDSRSPFRRYSRSPVRRYSRSPVRRHSRSPVRRHSRSPVRRHSRSPVRQHSRSPLRHYSRDSMRYHSRSPLSHLSRSPMRKNIRIYSKSPTKRHSKSTLRRISRSPFRKFSKSPSSTYSHLKHPRSSRKHSRTPHRHSRTSQRRRSRSPYQSLASYKRISKSPTYPDYGHIIHRKLKLSDKTSLSPKSYPDICYIEKPVDRNLNDLDPISDEDESLYFNIDKCGASEIKQLPPNIQMILVQMLQNLPLAKLDPNDSAVKKMMQYLNIHRAELEQLINSQLPTNLMSDITVQQNQPEMKSSTALLQQHLLSNLNVNPSITQQLTPMSVSYPASVTSLKSAYSQPVFPSSNNQNVFSSQGMFPTTASTSTLNPHTCSAPEFIPNQSSMHLHSLSQNEGFFPNKPVYSEVIFKDMQKIVNKLFGANSNPDKEMQTQNTIPGFVTEPDPAKWDLNHPDIPRFSVPTSQNIYNPSMESNFHNIGGNPGLPRNVGNASILPEIELSGRNYSSRGSIERQNLQTSRSNVQPPPSDAKVSFCDAPSTSNKANLFPVVSSAQTHGNEMRDYNHNQPSNVKKFLAHRLASVLVKLGMIDVPGQLLEEMVKQIETFSQRPQDFTEAEIVSFLKRFGYVS